MKCFASNHLTWVLLGNYLVLMGALVKENRRGKEFLSFMCLLIPAFPVPLAPCPAGETEAHLNYVQLDNIRIRCWIWKSSCHFLCPYKDQAQSKGTL